MLGGDSTVSLLFKMKGDLTGAVNASRELRQQIERDIREIETANNTGAASTDNLATKFGNLKDSIAPATLVAIAAVTAGLGAAAAITYKAAEVIFNFARTTAE